MSRCDIAGIFTYKPRQCKHSLKGQFVRDLRKCFITSAQAGLHRRRQAGFRHRRVGVRLVALHPVVKRGGAATLGRREHFENDTFPVELIIELANCLNIYLKHVLTFILSPPFYGLISYIRK